jgi:hypothetical protein
MSLLTRWLPKPFVVVESPYAGDVETNIAYAQWAVLDAVSRGETPYASHLLLTQVLTDSGAQRELGLSCCRDVPGERVYYVDRCDLVTRVSPPHLRHKLASQRRSLAWQLGYYLAISIGWCSALGLVFAALVSDVSLYNYAPTRYTLLPVFVGVLSAMWASAGLLRAYKRLRYTLELRRSGRLLSSGMFAAFVAKPGELRRLTDPNAIAWAGKGVGPVGSRMTWGLECPSIAYLDALAEQRKIANHADE